MKPLKRRHFAKPLLVPYTHIYMHICISVFFLTDMGMPHKTPVERGLCKTPTEKRFCEVPIEKVLCKAPGASRSPTERGFCKAPIERGFVRQLQ